MIIDFFFGKFLIILAFTSSLFSALIFFLAAKNSHHKQQWHFIAKIFFYITTVLMFIVAFKLMVLILTHQFQYNYVKHYSSTDLNIFYLISTFYAGQEGSFLLWILYVSVIGIILLHSLKQYNSEILATVVFSQSFLISMLLGLSVPFIGNIGSDPFTLTHGQTPLEGDGLNPLLQNPWMVIHPPTLFAGFSLTIVPFAITIASLWKKDYSLIKQAMPWTILSATILGSGIMMGGYWAYGVLGWGGYWGWDPVENSSLSPWLILIALIHTLLINKRSGRLTKTSLLLPILAHSLVLYSAFLTRSGALADYSVHSFTDLGLYSQLLIYVLTFFILGVSLWIFRFAKSRPTQFQTNPFASKEFLPLLGSLTILLISVVVTAGTSAPIINRFFTDKPDPILPEFYNSTLLPLAVIVALLCAFAQLLWWSAKKHAAFLFSLIRPSLFSLAIFLPLAFFVLNDFKTGVLLLTSFFAFFANVETFLKISLNKIKTAGGTFAHIGLALMLIGFVSTGKYEQSKIIELPKDNTITLFGKSITFTGTEGAGNGKTRFNLKVQNVGDSSTSQYIKPVFYETKRMSVQNPDILNELFQDYYVAPQNYFLRENPNQLILSKEEGSQKFHNMTVTFIGFNYEKSRLEPKNDQDTLKVTATIQITTETQSEIFEPTFEIFGGGKIKAQPVNISAIPNGKVALTNIDATNKKILLLFNGENIPTESQEVFIAQISTKPFINILWLGTLLMLFGMSLSIFKHFKHTADGSLKVDTSL